MPVAQDHTRCRNIQRESEQSDDKDQGRKSGQVGWFGYIQRDQNDQYGNRDRDGQHKVEQTAWQRYDDYGKDCHDEKDDT